MVGEQHVPLTAEREAAILREIRERGVGSSILFAFLRQGFTDYERDKRHKARKKLWSRMSRPERETVIAIEEART